MARRLRSRRLGHAFARSNFCGPCQPRWVAQKRLTRPAGRFLLLRIGIFALSSFAVEPASAAVRLCGERITGGQQIATTEPVARRAAIAAWLARVSGPPATTPLQPSWQLADGKSVACTRVDGGRFSCSATARPCVVSQIPQPGFTPRPRGVPPAPAVPPAAPGPTKAKPTIEA
jgi:hypothetical protein